ncbi:MAG: type II toxin-antitoxin system PemK/MazF family toxin [Myxacorys californica WJT36-NPBG1]|jgi:mRNA interferase MazF|nr:type II toxin-antitoxin system PemK/MazF family toxin [Myxacorys californica WJT36-NPBG1]
MRRGQIWLYNSNPSVGDEIIKVRPAVIVGNNEVGTLRLKIVTPITNWDDAFTRVAWMVKVKPSLENGLSKPSVDTFQVRSVSQQRLIRQLSILSEQTMREVTRALAIVLKIE